MGKKAFPFRVGLLLVVLFGLLAPPVFALDAREYNIYIVTDTVDDWSTGIMDGFKESLDRFLAGNAARARYTVFDTQLRPETAPGIISAIRSGKPDLICVVNYPSGFADSVITKQLPEPEYRFVSENALPIEIGLISDWARPGGNVTGVGVFLQQNSQIRLMKRINPDVRKLAFFSWSALEPVNLWFEREITRAAREEGIELVEFRRVANAEEEFEFLREYDAKSHEYFVMGGVSAFVHADGTPADMTVEEPAFIQEHIDNLQMISYDETTISTGYLAGASVIWRDIGAQLAEKGARILQGTNPGDIPWEFPRRYNIILNLKTASRIGITFPQSLIGAAYRVYTDYEGSFVGQ